MSLTDATTSTPESAGASAASASSNDSNVSAAQPATPVAIPEAAPSVADAIRSKVDGTALKAGGADKSQAAVAPDPTAPVVPVVPAGGQPPYTPNFKYKVAGQEKELDKFWQPLVKDADSEKKVKELLTKVDAFDFVKGKKEHFETEYSALQGEHEALNNTVTRFDNSVKSGDLTSAFRIAGIPKEQIFKWVNQQLQYMELPPEQRQQIEAAENQRLQNFDLEEKFSRMENQYQTQAVQARTMQLDMALMKPEVASFAAAWDENAEPGQTFRDMVAAEARRVWYDSQQDLSPEKAVAMVMGRFGRFVSPAGAGQVQSTQSTQQQVVPRSQQPPPVIPNVTGKAASPIKKVPKSLDEIRAIERAMPG